MFYKPDRDINKLKPEFKKKVDRFLKEVKPMGAFVTEAFRSAPRQTYLRATNKSWVKISNHQRGLAIDIAFKDDLRTKNIIEKDLYPNNIKRWIEVSEIASKYGIDWGYNLWGEDMPHFQDNGKRLISDAILKQIEDQNKIWARKSKELNEVLHDFNVITAGLCDLKDKEFIPYVIKKQK